jgi:3-hydroxyisobutyrate dehydrogenase-like beta-hydroxyacid dehydrogenase
MTTTIVLLHPGDMGASIGAALRATGNEVIWVDSGRSEATQRRAGKANLAAVGSLTEALERAQHVVSVCPPHAAVEVARSVADLGFSGRYVDGNAVAPATAAEIESIFGAQYVDGGIVGPPAWREGVTRLYLSGPGAEDVARWFDGSLVDARVIVGGPGAASALKMCYAAFTKGSSALILGIRALAESHGITEALLAEWEVSQKGLRERSENTARTTAPKAWRFEGEMREIAATFEGAGLPGGFHEAAAEIYKRMSGLKHADAATIEDVLAELLG